MTIEVITSLVVFLCPILDKESKEYTLQSEQVTCMEYYTNDIVNNPNKYEKMVKYAKSK